MIPAHASPASRNHDHLKGAMGSLALHALLLTAFTLWMSRPRSARVAPEDYTCPLYTPPDTVHVTDPAVVTPGCLEDEGMPSPGDDTMRPDDIDLTLPVTQGQGDIQIICPSPVLLDDLRVGLAFVPAFLPAEWSVRVDKKQRLAAGHDASVTAALCWLRDHQNPDGSWGTSHTVGYTGLALLTFLAHGELPGSETYGPCLERAVERLLLSQDPEGRFAANAGHAFVYEHAIATYALAEMYGLSRIPAVRTAAEHALPVIIRGQQPDGSWGYGYDPRGTRADTSVTAWQMQALAAARIAGISVDGVDAAMDRGLAGLRALRTTDGSGFSYATGQPRCNPGLSAAGLLGFHLRGQGGAEAVRGVLPALRDTAWNAQASEGWPLYTVYYEAQALFHGGNTAFAPWAKRNLPALARAQHPDGSWNSASPSEGGADDLTRKVHATTLAALTLQTSHRTHLGTGRPVAQETSTGREAPTEIEVDIRL